MQEDQRRAAKGLLIALMQAGHPWHEAAVMAGVHIGRSAAYQLLCNVRMRGEAALQDGRHGHPAKLRPSVREFLEITCREAPHTPSHVVQAALQERFGVLVSIGYLNRVRAELGIGSRTVHREKNFSSLARQRYRTFKRGAGALLLVAAAQETGLLSTLEAALSSCPLEAGSRLAHLSCTSHRMLVLTLLLLGVVGLRRTWDLRGYTGGALALLSGRKRAYGYFHTERLLSQMARANQAELLTGALAAWTTQLWHPPEQQPLGNSTSYYMMDIASPSTPRG